MRAPIAFPLVVLALAACAGVGERTDTSKILPVEDINARDTTPAPPPLPVARLSLMDSLPMGGICTVKRYRSNADQAREITYETSAPMRTYVIEIGKPPRRFGPVSLDMRGTQLGGDRTETENVYVGFSAAGAVTVGTRRYTVTGAVNDNERAPLNAGDSAIVLRFANTILGLCDTGR